MGPDDLALKIQEIREATDWQIPIQLKLGAARVYDDVRMAVKTDPDSIYIDGNGAGARDRIWIYNQAGADDAFAVRPGQATMDWGSDGVNVTELLMTAYMSAEQGRTIEFPPPDLDSFVPAVARGEWNVKRLVNVEELDPDPFMALMPELGIEWHVREDGVP